MVKGAFLGHYIQTIKNRKDIDWSKHLSPEDLVFLQKRIVDNEWYPLDIFERIGTVIFKEIAHEDPAIVRLWARIRANELAKIYENMICVGDPYESLIRFMVVRQNFFNFSPINVTVFFKNYAKLEIAFELNPLAEKGASYQTLGYFERLLELSGAVNVKHNFLRKRWEGDKSTVLEFSWSNVRPEMKVKGILFLESVKMLKKQKDINFDEYLLPQDLPFLNQEIQPSEWYPFDTFERIGVALLKIEGEPDFETILALGQAYVNDVVRSFPSLLCPGDPRETIMRFQVLRNSFFNFNAFNIETFFSNYLKMRIQYEMCRLAEKATCYQSAGFFIQLLQFSGAKEVTYKFPSKSWEGDPTTILELYWK